MKERKQETEGKKQWIWVLRSEEEVLKCCFLCLLSSFNTGSESVLLNPRCPSVYLEVKTHTQGNKASCTFSTPLQRPAIFRCVVLAYWIMDTNTGKIWTITQRRTPDCHITPVMDKQVPGKTVPNHTLLRKLNSSYQTLKKEVPRKKYSISSSRL